MNQNELLEEDILGRPVSEKKNVDFEYEYDYDCCTLAFNTVLLWESTITIGPIGIVLFLKKLEC